MRKKIIIGNWKMNLSLDSAQDLTFKLKSHMDNGLNVEAGICPPSIYLGAMSSITKGSNLLLGAQNMYFEEKGAFTGEIAPAMLKDYAVDMVIIGHSERREVFGECDETVNKKIKAALANGLTPVFCVGENLETREGGNADGFVKAQVEKGLEGLSAEDISKLIVAYEPIWAIGTGKVCSGEDANKIISMIRETIKAKSNAEVASGIRILYGGSVKSSNFDEHLKYEDIDGGLVGGASLKADEFIAIIDLANKMSTANCS